MEGTYTCPSSALLANWVSTRAGYSFVASALLLYCLYFLATCIVTLDLANNIGNEYPKSQNAARISAALALMWTLLGVGLAIAQFALMRNKQKTELVTTEQQE